MKTGDRIKIYNVRGDSYETGTVIETFENSVKYKHDKIPGYFVCLKKLVAPIEATN